MNISSILNKLSTEYTEETYKNGNFGSTSISSKKLFFQLSKILFDKNTFNEELLENIKIIEDKFNSLFNIFSNLSAQLSFTQNGRYIYNIRFFDPDFKDVAHGDNNIFVGDFLLEGLLSKLDYLIENPHAFDRYKTGREFFIDGKAPLKNSFFVIKDQNGYKTKIDYKYTQDISEAKVYSANKTHYEHGLKCDVVHHRLDKDYVRICVS